MVEMLSVGAKVLWNETGPYRMEAYMELGDGIKKFFLIGIGAAATSVEKSGEILGDLVKKGELTVEQGKALNQELRHNAEEKKKKFDEDRKNKSLNDLVSGLSAEDIAKLKELLAAAETAPSKENEEPAAEEPAE